jgi:hypothetical protein
MVEDMAGVESAMGIGGGGGGVAGAGVAGGESA